MLYTPRVSREPETRFPKPPRCSSPALIVAVSEIITSSPLRLEPGQLDRFAAEHMNYLEGLCDESKEGNSR